MDGVGQDAHLTQGTASTAEPYRRHIIGLPLQRSVFALTARAATSIGLPGLTSERDFPSWLDENGDLILDRAQVAALVQDLPSHLTPETLELMYTRHVAACKKLMDATERAARIPASGNGKETELAKDLANKIAVVLSYGILSKFVPDLLWRVLADGGDIESPPFPETSAGGELMQNSFALYQACSAVGYDPERLEQEWPDVSSEAFQLVSEFCRRQTGFGPLAWDSPGYEDPSYVTRLLRSAFQEVDSEQVSRRFVSSKRSTPSLSTSKMTSKTAALTRLLGFWLDFLERETWYVRRAFFVGMAPILQQLAASYRQERPAFETVDLLFLELPELTEATADLALIRGRRQGYMENIDYLRLHGIDQRRLQTILARS